MILSLFASYAFLCASTASFTTPAIRFGWCSETERSHSSKSGRNRTVVGAVSFGWDPVLRGTLKRIRRILT
jgi:hypothetical protein